MDAMDRAQQKGYVRYSLSGPTRGVPKIKNQEPRTKNASPFVLQIVFNEISAAEMSALPKEMQLDLLAEFQFLPEDLENLDTEKFGVVERDGKRLFRYRAKEYPNLFRADPGGNHRASCSP